MSVFGVFHVSSSAMEAQRYRMNLIASNLANQQTTKTEEGGPYKRQDVVFQTTNLEDNSLYDGVKVAEIVQDPGPPMLVYDPKHPDANDKGYVEMPNINTVEEMVNMMSSVRVYEANVSAFNISKAMFLKTLELGR
ncbi:MAG: flagellar basal body rod protein FlgC [Candidatus Magnetoovum sp. WYHC-5]|nr:flagellar basal body rod protein FlgC [Candidatus Magnetoovum sp. WYHC-5]